MTKNDWYETGEQIKNLVQDAVDTGDFSQLGNTISNVVNDAMDGLQDALRGNLGGQGSRQGGYSSYGPGCNRTDNVYENTNGDCDQTYRGSADRTRRAYEQAYGQTAGRSSSSQSAGQAYDRRYQPPMARRKVPGELGSKVMKYVGLGLGAMFGGVLALEALAAAAVGDMVLFLGSGIVTGIFCAGSLAFGVAGQKRLGLSRRFRRYQEVIGGRTYCKIEELASGIGGTAQYVAKDLKNMIRRGYFPVGYLDRKETLLITDQSTYQQYLQTEEEYEKRKREQKAAGAAGYGAFDAASAGASTTAQADMNREADAASGDSTTKRSPEHQALIDEGKRYIRHIHECNEKIPGEEITAKLTRLELVVTRIFREAEKDPGAVTDLRKMMSYYLPTTQKLLDAYCELDAQPAEGKNMAETKKEIESALDTINTAFENLLDSLYEEQAWDISSDISVLNAMLAQEGLTGGDFAKATAGTKA